MIDGNYRNAWGNREFDAYAGKLDAALDRQYLRDLLTLSWFSKQKISSECSLTFSLGYLLSGARPSHLGQCE